MTTPGPVTRVGVDLVRVSRIAESLQHFGARFLRRIFTDDEVAYATASPPQTAERLAARFAAKEATIKALGLVDRGVAWRDIEVRRAATGGCTMALHGAAGAAAAALGAGAFAVSLTHEGEYAAAIVVTHVGETTKS